MSTYKNHNNQDSFSDEGSNDDILDDGNDRSRYSKEVYDVVVKTGDIKYCGTDNQVRIKIVGNKGETKLTRLSHLLKDNFERDQTDEFTLKGKMLEILNTYV